MMMRSIFMASALGLFALAACSSKGNEGNGGEATTTTSTASTTTTTSTTTTSTTTTGTGGTGTGGTGTGGAATGGSGTGGSGTGGMAAFALTSDGFTEGTVIPDKYSCQGANVSPALAWTAGPAGTQSYAVVFTDKSNQLIHWVIWDIPASVTSLPEDVQNAATPTAPAGAKQVKSYDNNTFGYLGPCPPNMHTYEFVVYALDVATLPNVTTASTRPEVKAEILNHDLASTPLSGTFTP